VNTWIDELKDLPKNEFFRELASRMDKEIHAGYELLFPNYVALDILNGNDAHADKYDDAQKKSFISYVDARIAKIDIPNKDEAFLRERILTMYANPLRNYLAAK
jgi:hypothetical protein